MEQGDNSIHTNEILMLLQSAKARRDLAGCEYIFGDPALEILLALSLYQENQNDIIERVIETVNLPHDNFFRWLAALENVGFIECSPQALALTSRGHEILSATIPKFNR